MVCVYTAISFLGLAVWFYFVHREIGLRLREALADLLPYAAIAAVTMAATALITSPVDNVYLLLPLKIITAVLLYAVLMWLCGSATFRECTDFLLQKYRKRPHA